MRCPTPECESRSWRDRCNPILKLWRCNVEPKPCSYVAQERELFRANGGYFDRIVRNVDAISGEPNL